MIITKNRYIEMLNWVKENPDHELVAKYGKLSPKWIVKQLAIVSLVKDITKYETEVD